MTGVESEKIEYNRKKNIGGFPALGKEQLTEWNCLLFECKRPLVREIKSAVWEILHWRCLLDIEIEMLNREFDFQILNSGESFELKRYIWLSE